MSETYFKLWFLSKFLLFTLIGSMLFRQGCTNYLKIKEAEKWQTVNATIIKHEINRGINSHDQVYFEPNIIYEYSISGKVYSNNIIQFGTYEELHTEWEAERKISDYPYGQVIPIKVDPQNPKNSVINPGDTNSEKPLMYYGIFFLLLAYLFNRKTINHIIKKLFLKNYSRKNEGWIVAQ